VEGCEGRSATETYEILVIPRVVTEGARGEFQNFRDVPKITLLTNLEDPTVQESLKLLKKGQRKHIDTFLKKRTLPDPLEQDFIDAVKEALSGLLKVEVKVEELKAALLKAGSPATLEELKKRFDEFLAELSKGKDSGKVRIVLE